MARNIATRARADESQLAPRAIRDRFAYPLGMDASWRDVLLLSLFVCGCGLPTGGLAPTRDSGPARRDATADAFRPDGELPDSGRDAGADSGRDAGADSGRDAGTDSGRDAGVPDSGRDAGADSGRDAGAADSGASDAGSACTSADDRCDGDTRVVCDTGTLVREDCTASSAYCDVSSGTPTCVDWACTPSSSECSDVAEQTVCDARGTAQTVSACPRGCDDATGACRPETPCSLSVEGRISTGRMTFDTCSGGDNASPVSGCTDVDISGGDRILRLEVPEAARYRIDLNEAPGASEVDPMVYLRRRCDERASELACNDDRPRRNANSRIELDLEPGDYFIVMDSYRASGDSLPGDCGPSEVNVTIR